MFAFTERTRRRLCRAGFVAFCLLPTLLVSAWIGVSRLPSRHAAAEELLSARLDARVTIGAIGTPRQGVLRYDDVAVSDAFTHQPLLLVKRIEIRDDGAACTAMAEGGRFFVTDKNEHGRQGLWPLLLRS